MIDALALSLTLACLLSAISLGIRTIRGTYRGQLAVAALAVLELGLLLQAVIDMVAVCSGRGPRPAATHLCYLTVSVLVAPVLAVQVRGDDGRWSAVLAASGCLALAIIVIRLQTTWRGHG